MRQRLYVLFVLLILTLSISGSIAAQGYKVVVVNEQLNVRVAPEFGAQIIDTVLAGYTFEIITGRTSDSQWLRVEYAGEEAWINIAPLTVLSGDIAALPVANPLAAPYGGNEAPRSGTTTQAGTVIARATDGLRVRSGPSTAYATLANINFNQQFTILGRTRSAIWYQVNFNGTLGWVRRDFVEIISGDVLATPVDGIIADQAPTLSESIDDYIGQLRLMLDRLSFAQSSLNTIRAYWTDSALTGRANCQPYPAQPSDLSIPFPLLTNYFDTLNPLQTDFNDAMFNIRLAIDLFIQVCNQPGSGNPVGTATIQGALDTVNLAEQQIESLRGRINALVPPAPNANECLLVFNKRTQVLPIIQVNSLYKNTFSRNTLAQGYCFDGIEGQSVTFQTLPLPDSDLILFITLSPLDTPDSFVAINRATQGQRAAIGPVTLPRTTTYLLIIADTSSGDGRQAYGDFAFRVGIVPPDGAIETLVLDANGTVIVTTDPALTGSSTAATTSSGTPVPTATPFGFVATSTPSATCPSTSFTCTQFFSCSEAKACLAAGNFSLDPDGNGIPCEENRCTSPDSP